MAVSPEEHERVLAELGEAKTRIEKLEEQQATLLAAMEKLREELKKNSSNSNLPPSSDGPGAASRGLRKSKKPKSKRKRGGQKGHKGSHRVLVEASEVDAFEDFYPEACEACASLLPQVPDEAARLSTTSPGLTSGLLTVLSALVGASEFALLGVRRCGARQGSQEDRC